MSEQIISFDCFLLDAEVDMSMFGGSYFFFKAFLTAFSPFLVIFILAFCWILAKLILRKRVNLVDNLILSIITSIYFLHSTLGTTMLSLFKCFPVEGVSYVERDMEIECFSGTHLTWALGLGGPYLLLWTIGLPVLGFAYLTWNVKKHHTQKF